MLASTGSRPRHTRAARSTQGVHSLRLKNARPIFEGGGVSELLVAAANAAPPCTASSTVTLPACNSACDPCEASHASAEG